MPTDFFDHEAPHDPPNTGPWLGHNTRARKAMETHKAGSDLPTDFWPTPLAYETNLGNAFILPLALLLYGSGRPEALVPGVNLDCRVPIIVSGPLLSLVARRVASCLTGDTAMLQPPFDAITLTDDTRAMLRFHAHTPPEDVRPCILFYLVLHTSLPPSAAPYRQGHDPLAEQLALRLEQQFPQVLLPVIPIDLAARVLADPAIAKWFIAGYDRALELAQPGPVAFGIRALASHVTSLRLLQACTPFFEPVFPAHPLAIYLSLIHI